MDIVVINNKLMKVLFLCDQNVVNSLERTDLRSKKPILKIHLIKHLLGHINPHTQKLM